MIAIFKFEVGTYFKKPFFYIAGVAMAALGLLIGYKAGMGAGPEIYKNSPYVLYQVTGLLSLLGILFTTLLGTQIIFRESDANFSLILYATPLQKLHYLGSRLAAVFLLSFLLFAVLITGMALAHLQLAGREQFQAFNAMDYLHPLFFLGGINILFCTAVVGAVGWLGKNKMLVYVSGLLLYISYMAALIFSSSPMMAGALPQSKEAMQLSALLDPFGVSAFYYHTINWSVIQRNGQLPSLSGFFLLNRLLVLGFVAALLLVIFNRFRFSASGGGKKRSEAEAGGSIQINRPLRFVLPRFSYRNYFQNIFSIVRLDLTYVVKSIPFIIIILSFLFYLSMEMYALVEKGIRLPQQYASSGLMARAIMENFHTLCLLALLFYANDLSWRSRISRFHFIEDATPVIFPVVFLGKWFSVTVIVVVLTTFMNILGITFQFAYHYPHIQWEVYASMYWAISFPLILSAGIILCLQRFIKNRFASLVVATVVMLVTATGLGGNLGITHPLLNFQLPLSNRYSDFNGWGSYFTAFSFKMIFAASSVALLVALCVLPVLKRRNPSLGGLVLLLLLIVVFSGAFVAKKYQPIDEAAQIEWQAQYESNFRRYQRQPQPTVTEITTQVSLSPENGSYHVDATYKIRNKTSLPVNQVLVNFDRSLGLKNSLWKSHREVIKVDSFISVIKLQKPLLPGDSAQLQFSFSYAWDGFNPHHPFNAIVGNGSFIRISNYYPRIGYQPAYELGNEALRARYGLGGATPLTKLEEDRKKADDFIMLDMTVSTASDQTAIGVGSLMQKWQHNGKNYFHYKTPSPIPFRFAVSSAKYAVKSASHRGKLIEVYYHPRHYENVAHLIENARHTLDYCEKNFSPYPYPVIRFAEVSAFTRGFAATAYPSVIYMTEDMIFHANIKADKKQDVINELAGHELSHQWWGNAQLAPDFQREGAAVLTETLAMYTELMMAKKIHGKDRLLELVQMHADIYKAERGYVSEQPLVKYAGSNPALVYNKGAVIMYQLSELIGEEKLNLALRNLILNHAYPGPVPVASDLVREIRSVADSTHHPTISEMFEKIAFVDMNLFNYKVSRQEGQYRLSFNIRASKFYEDGRGKRSQQPFKQPVEVSVQLASGLELKYLLAVDSISSFNLLFADKPVKIKLDPNHHYMHYQVPGSVEQ
jgi:ABC-2 type transport system permease protein